MRERRAAERDFIEERHKLIFIGRRTKLKMWWWVMVVYSGLLFGVDNNWRMGKGASLIIFYG
jgi:hypothetical protein